ncbi:putative polygalacturonase [Arachis hypogaea]|nr:putative polygalacturonase [Arachis hypogaea]
MVAVLLLVALSTALESNGEEYSLGPYEQKAWNNARPHSVLILEFGAVGDGKTLNTVAFQNAICYLKSFTDKGGAQLYVPSGKWLTGSLNFVSHLTLFLERRATIVASLISRTLAAADSTEIIKKLPKFMYDEEKALEEDQALAKEGAEIVVLVIDEEGVESLISELVKGVNEPKLLWFARSIGLPPSFLRNVPSAASEGHPSPFSRNDSFAKSIDLPPPLSDNIPSE